MYKKIKHTKMSVLGVTFSVCVLALSPCGTLLKVWLEFRPRPSAPKSTGRGPPTDNHPLKRAVTWAMQRRHETKGSLFKREKDTETRREGKTLK